MKYNSFDESGLVRVLRFLQAHDDEYLSGQDLSDVLRISRVAVWKHIRKIRELGYSVESRQKLGYRLLSDSDELLPWEVTSGLKTEVIGQRAYYFGSTESTQKEAQTMAADPANNGAVVAAAKQTHGRGREGKRWISQDGGIWFSVIIHPRFEISVATLFPVAASVALAAAVEQTLGITPELKWPNDLTLDGKKAAGILVYAALESNRIQNMIVGVGINFDVDAGRIGDALKDSPGFYGAASLGREDVMVRPVRLVQAFLTELEGICNELNSGRVEKIVSEWTRRSSTIGRYVEVNVPDGTVSGKAVRIDDDGALVVLGDGKTHRIVAGSITSLS